MTEADALDVLRQALIALSIASAPAIVAAMVVGLAIALLQALTQVQEQTLTFVPKIIVIGVVLTVSAPFLGAQIATLSVELYGRIEKGYSR